MSPTSRRDYFWDQLSDPDYRTHFVDAQTREVVSGQIRTMRADRQWSQADFAARCDTTQSVVSQLENPNYGRHSITTLRKIAAAFDVALVVRFVPFSELVDWSVDATEASFHVPEFSPDPRHAPASFVYVAAPPEDVTPESGTGENDVALPGSWCTREHDNVDVPSEALPITYTNSIRMTVSLFDFQFEVGVRTQGAPGQEPTLQPSQRITMSPQHAKVLSRLLARNIEAYEKKFGPIATEPLPDEAGSTETTPQGEQSPGDAQA